MSNSICSTLRRKRKHAVPRRPRRDFPLSPHPGEFWCRKIRGKVHYFGRWGHRVNGKFVRSQGDDPDGWQAPEAEYERAKADVHAGRTLRVAKHGEMTLADLCHLFIAAEMTARHNGELGQRSLELGVASRASIFAWRNRLQSFDTECGSVLFERLTQTFNSDCACFVRRLMRIRRGECKLQMQQTNHC